MFCFVGGRLSHNRFASKYNNEHISKLALFGAAAPCEVRKEDFPYGLPIEILNNLIELNSSNRPQLIEEFGKLLGASETALPKSISDWLARIQFQSSIRDGTGPLSLYDKGFKSQGRS